MAIHSSWQRGARYSAGVCPFGNARAHCPDPSREFGICVVSLKKRKQMITKLVIAVIAVLGNSFLIVSQDVSSGEKVAYTVVVATSPESGVIVPVPMTSIAEQVL